MPVVAVKPVGLRALDVQTQVAAGGELSEPAADELLLLPAPPQVDGERAPAVADIDAPVGVRLAKPVSGAAQIAAHVARERLPKGRDRRVAAVYGLELVGF